MKNDKNKQEEQLEEGKDTKGTKEPDGNKLEELKIKVDECELRYKRALADYQNLERRFAQEKSELTSRLEEGVVRRLLPIIDVFDEMVKHDPYRNDQGLKSVRMQIHDVFMGYGVTHKIIEGTEFNPNIMECIQVEEVEDAKQDNIVLKEIVKVYFYRDRLLRPAKVVVGNKKE